MNPDNDHRMPQLFQIPNATGCYQGTDLVDAKGYKICQVHTDIRLQTRTILYCSSHVLMAPIAAKQGAHRRLNTRKPYAATGVITCARLPQISAPSSATSAKPKSIPKVATTFSFAIRPVTAATAIFQPSPAFVHPSGAKIHAIADTDLCQEYCCSVPLPCRRLPSSQPKPIRNQRMIVESKNDSSCLFNKGPSTLPHTSQIHCQLSASGMPEAP